MGLEAVPLGRRAAVVAHRERQEMELDVGIIDPGRERMKPQLSNWFEAPGPRLPSSHRTPTHALPGRFQYL